MEKKRRLNNFPKNRFKFLWVVALRCEANALIIKFKLRSFSSRSNFPIYLNYENGHALVISGVGSVKSGVAAMYLNNIVCPGPYAAWINIGIAGHCESPVGTFFQAIKVVNRDSGESFFPGLRLPDVPNIGELNTVSRPESKFDFPGLYDMEASGFCEIAPSFSCNELTFVFKIVSDTSETSKSLISNKMVLELFEKNLLAIDILLKTISRLVSQEEVRLADPVKIEEITSSLHFTETNYIRLQKLHQKWCCVFPEKSLCEKARKFSSAKDLLMSMESDIAEKVENWSLK